MAAPGWLRGTVKEVPSGDTVVIAAGARPGAIPAEKRLTLASVQAPKLVRNPWAPGSPVGRSGNDRAARRPRGT